MTMVDALDTAMLMGLSAEAALLSPLGAYLPRHHRGGERGPMGAEGGVPSSYLLML